jgi:Na+/phosphate symporter
MSWVLLIITLLQSLAVCLAIGFITLSLALMQQMAAPGQHSMRFGRALALAAAVIVPAIWLVRFYFVMATQTRSVLYAKVGWIISSVYHAQLACLLLFFMPGTVQSSGSSIKVPLSFFSGAALVVSLYLLIRYPRPPALPSQRA